MTEPRRGREDTSDLKRDLLLLEERLDIADAAHTAGVAANVLSIGTNAADIGTNAAGIAAIVGGPTLFPSTIPIGSVAYGSLGTDAVHVAGTQYMAPIDILHNTTVTNIHVLNGTVVGTDNIRVDLYNNAGVLLGGSAVAGVLTAGADAFQTLVLLAPVAITGPGRYWVAVQVDGGVDTTRRVAANTYLTLSDAVAAAGGFGTPDNPIAIPATFTADEGPIAYLS